MAQAARSVVLIRRKYEKSTPPVGLLFARPFPIFEFMKLFTLLDSESVKTDLRPGDKYELINALVQTLAPKLPTGALEPVRQAVLERERLMSTGVGKGFALPHGKTQAVDRNHGAFAVLPDPVAFDSLDQQPVRLVFLLVGPSSDSSTHIQLLSRISRLMNHDAFRLRLLECRTPQSVLQAFKDEENRFSIR